jgi:hypothetical protein
MKWPRGPSQHAIVMGLLGVLLASSVIYTHEALRFCERAVFDEMGTIAREGTADKPLSFRDVCPEARQRAENQLNRWLEVLLALLVQLPGRGPGDGPGPGP